jgi:hypothetical protein
MWDSPSVKIIIRNRIKIGYVNLILWNGNKVTNKWVASTVLITNVHENLSELASKFEIIKKMIKKIN